MFASFSLRMTQNQNGGSHSEFAVAARSGVSHSGGAICERALLFESVFRIVRGQCECNFPHFQWKHWLLVHVVRHPMQCRLPIMNTLSNRRRWISACRVCPKQGCQIIATIVQRFDRTISLLAHRAERVQRDVTLLVFSTRCELFIGPTPPQITVLCNKMKNFLKLIAPVDRKVCSTTLRNARNWLAERSFWGMPLPVVWCYTIAVCNHNHGWHDIWSTINLHCLTCRRPIWQDCLLPSTHTISYLACTGRYCERWWKCPRLRRIVNTRRTSFANELTSSWRYGHARTVANAKISTLHGPSGTGRVHSTTKKPLRSVHVRNWVGLLQRVQWGTASTAYNATAQSKANCMTFEASCWPRYRLDSSA